MPIGTGGEVGVGSQDVALFRGRDWSEGRDLEGGAALAATLAVVGAGHVASAGDHVVALRAPAAVVVGRVGEGRGGPGEVAGLGGGATKRLALFCGVVLGLDPVVQLGAGDVHVVREAVDLGVLLCEDLILSVFGTRHFKRRGLSHQTEGRQKKNDEHLETTTHDEK